MSFMCTASPLLWAWTINCFDSVGECVKGLVSICLTSGASCVQYDTRMKPCTSAARLNDLATSPKSGEKLIHRLIRLNSTRGKMCAAILVTTLTALLLWFCLIVEVVLKNMGLIQRYDTKGHTNKYCIPGT